MVALKNALWLKKDLCPGYCCNGGGCWEGTDAILKTLWHLWLYQELVCGWGDVTKVWMHGIWNKTLKRLIWDYRGLTKGEEVAVSGMLCWRWPTVSPGCGWGWCWALRRGFLATGPGVERNRSTAADRKEKSKRQKKTKESQEKSEETWEEALQTLVISPESLRNEDCGCSLVGHLPDALKILSPVDHHQQRNVDPKLKDFLSYFLGLESHFSLSFPLFRPSLYSFPPCSLPNLW